MTYRPLSAQEEHDEEMLTARLERDREERKAAGRPTAFQEWKDKHPKPEPHLKLVK